MAKIVTQSGFKWSVSIGENMSIWDLDWLETDHHIEKLLVLHTTFKNMKVSDLIMQNTNNENIKTINLFFNTTSSRKNIYKMPIFAYMFSKTMQFES